MTTWHVWPQPDWAGTITSHNPDEQHVVVCSILLEHDEGRCWEKLTVFKMSGRSNWGTVTANFHLQKFKVQDFEMSDACWENRVCCEWLHRWVLAHRWLVHSAKGWWTLRCWRCSSQNLLKCESWVVFMSFVSETHNAFLMRWCVWNELMTHEIWSFWTMHQPFHSSQVIISEKIQGRFLKVAFTGCDSRASWFHESWIIIYKLMNGSQMETHNSWGWNSRHCTARVRKHPRAIWSLAAGQLPEHGHANKPHPLVGQWLPGVVISACQHAWVCLGQWAAAASADWCHVISCALHCHFLLHCQVVSFDQVRVSHGQRQSRVHITWWASWPAEFIRGSGWFYLESNTVVGDWKKHLVYVAPWAINDHFVCASLDGTVGCQLRPIRSLFLS